MNGALLGFPCSIRFYDLSRSILVNDLQLQTKARISITTGNVLIRIIESIPQ